METLIYQTASGLARRIWQGELSSREVVAAHLAQIETHNPQINAVITLNAEAAMARAAAADEALAHGECWGVLHGVPITVKDAYDTAGLRTTYGLPETRKHVPDRNATAVQRLLSAGAILLGKTNLPLASFDWQCKNLNFGRTNNPWDLKRTVGGSSGGSAASLAAGFAALELGSDAAGSLRVPAHFCGVATLRPTEGRVSDFGAHRAPRYPRLLRHMATCGPMARSIGDLQLAMSVISGADRALFEMPPVVWNAPETRPKLARLRVAWAETLGGVPIDAETSRIFRAFLGRLEGAGCELVESSPAGIHEAFELWGQIQGHLMTATLPTALRFPLLRLPLRHMLLPYLFGRGPFARGLGQAVRLSNGPFYRALTERERLVALSERFFDEHQVFVCPVAPTAAFKHQRTGKALSIDGQMVAYGTAMGMYNCPSALAGNPIVAMPVGKTGEGLPVAVQIQARRWQDPVLLEIAADMERLIDTSFIPPLTAPTHQPKQHASAFAEERVS